ncbi:hypothetical protein ACIO6U_02645 [Streptomyces sp. NPDC087422]|uniref:hypothetical protein n=1 Tax=Streptomyces sp. NPDC087422 TaxID=3365786 RepID=UPI0038000E55
MRLTVVSGDKQVHVRVKGNGRKKLRQAEATARRLLDATPEPVAKPPIGFAVSADTETVQE